MAKSRLRFNMCSICSICLYDDPGLHDHRNVTQNLGIRERIAANRNEIGDFAGRQSADVG